MKAAGGQVLGEVRHPLNTSDFSSFLLQAQTSSAKIVGLACRAVLMVLIVSVPPFGKVLGKPIDVLVADHQNKADVGASIAREWFDREGVVMVQDLMNSAVALAGDEPRRHQRPRGHRQRRASIITNERCTPNSIQYTWDTYALAKSTAQARR